MSRQYSEGVQMCSVDVSSKVSFQVVKDTTEMMKLGSDLPWEWYLSGSAEDSAAITEKVELHVQGDCRPCMYFGYKLGCVNGDSCKFCHFPHRKQARPRLSKAKRARQKERAATEQQLQNHQHVDDSPTSSSPVQAALYADMQHIQYFDDPPMSTSPDKPTSVKSEGTSPSLSRDDSWIAGSSCQESDSTMECGSTLLESSESDEEACMLGAEIDRLVVDEPICRITVKRTFYHLEAVEFGASSLRRSASDPCLPLLFDRSQ